MARMTIMARTTMAIVILACGVGQARAQARPAAAGAAPRDIREVFLALPVPVPAAAASRPVLSRVASRISTRQRRQETLERSLASPGTATVLDVRNGYLDLCVIAPVGEDCVASVVVTYFVRGNGERLVVMQALDLDPWGVESYFWRLAGGRFTPVDGSTLLPRLTYADFWGDQPLPRGLSPRFLREISPLVVEWPQTGTTARAHVHPNFGGVKDKDQVRKLIDLNDQGLFASVTLVWDRGRGVFTKGEREEHDPEDHHH